MRRRTSAYRQALRDDQWPELAQEQSATDRQLPRLLAGHGTEMPVVKLSLGDYKIPLPRRAAGAKNAQ